MGMAIFALSVVESRTHSRPESCPYCDSRVLQGWGWETKLIDDFQLARVTVHRYRCEDCERTFRHYPVGVDQADQSLRIRQAAAILWGLGLSLRIVVKMIEAMGIRLSASSVWRASQTIDRPLRKRLSARFRPVLADNPEWLARECERFGSVVVLKLDDETSIGVGVIDAPQTDLRALAEALGVDVSFVSNPIL